MMTDWLADEFEENRSHLRSVAYRMLGSLEDADDAVQEAWLRLSRRRAVVDAFVAAARDGDFEALLAVLDPDVLLRADREPATKGIRGAQAVASQAAGFSRVIQHTEPVVVNGSPWIVSWLPNGEPLSILGFIVTRDRIREIYVISQPDRVHQLLGLA